jgi:uncharacterized protein YkwD
MRKYTPFILCLACTLALAIFTLACQPATLPFFHLKTESTASFVLADPLTVSTGGRFVPVALEQNKQRELRPTLTSSGLTLKVLASVSNATTQSTFEAKVLTLINAERTKRGLGKLALSSQLTAAARAHSADMATRNYFSHTGLDGSTMTSRINATGYKWLNIGETLYAGSGSYNTPESCVTSWMNSTGHRQILLNPVYTQVGIGYSYNAKSKYGGYFTADFGKPR